jgi:hypothetical protein
MLIDGQADMTKLTVAFCNSADVPKNRLLIVIFKDTDSCTYVQQYVTLAVQTSSIHVNYTQYKSQFAPSRKKTYLFETNRWVLMLKEKKTFFHEHEVGHKYVTV